MVKQTYRMSVLPWLAVAKGPDGSFIVDEAKVVPSGTVVRV